MPGYLYRRPSGVYVVRICVPQRLRQRIGRREIHVSTKCREAAQAKASAFGILTAWQQWLLELSKMDVVKVSEGSPLLAGDGFIRIEDVEKQFGFDRQVLLNELLNSKAEVFCRADGWHCIKIENVSDVERDFDGSFLLSPAQESSDLVRVEDVLMLACRVPCLQAFAGGRVHEETVFWQNRNKKSAYFFRSLGHVALTYADCLVEKQAVELIRTRLAAAVTPQMLESARAKISEAITTPSSATPIANSGGMRASELLKEYVEQKSPGWKPDRTKRVQHMCGRFVDLMGDPKVADLDREMARKYMKLLLRLPLGIDAAKKKYGTESLHELMESAESNGDPTMRRQTANDYLDKLSEMLSWAVREEFISRNPTKGLSVPNDEQARSQDQREQFTVADLGKIFSAEWFASGAGKPNGFGRFNEYQPHYYWLPLLGLFTGGRLNELSQLYLADIKQDSGSTWYLDFNLDGVGKIDCDEIDDQANGGDKSLKTVNALRKVPVHRILIKLGFIDYVQALRDAGFERLFPELRFDKTKGYGKAAGSWFNERYLGKKLGIERNGRKTFHSLRHTFATAIFNADVPELKVAQVLGHERGKTISAERYKKDSFPMDLCQHVDKVTFELPAIQPFSTTIGLVALQHALDRKARHANNLKKQKIKK